MESGNRNLLSNLPFRCLYVQFSSRIFVVNVKILKAPATYLPTYLPGPTYCISPNCIFWSVLSLSIYKALRVYSHPKYILFGNNKFRPELLLCLWEGGRRRLKLVKLSSSPFDAGFVLVSISCISFQISKLQIWKKYSREGGGSRLKLVLYSSNPLMSRGLLLMMWA